MNTTRRFTGRQITTMIVAAFAAITFSPWGAFAASGQSAQQQATGADRATDSGSPKAHPVNAERKLTPFCRSNIDPLRGLLEWFYLVLVAVVGGGPARCVRVR